MAYQNVRRYPDSRKKFRFNFQIQAPQVRLIDSDGQQLGIVDRKQALQKARERELDLVEIVPNASPPVCRIMDLNKFLYEQKKKEKEIKKKQKVFQTKEIRFTPETSEHDYRFKKQHVEDFLKEGHRVKVTIFYKGREIIHKERGYQLLERLTKELADTGKVERAPKLEGPRLSVTFIPV
ncbi:MAG TPA: translation initiation factor IF-3 [bacterium]|nr:translation initiation factor IF-3 [bacterium]HPP29804.1 translation initiation factor IF-3 [bacterium]